jgi:hypothetical protein
VGGGEYRLIGREEVDGRPAWHVRFTFGEGERIDFWIDERNGFRVYRVDRNAVQTVSYYENESYPWLPNRVVSRAYRQWQPRDDEAPRYTTKVLILRATPNVKFAKDRWTLAGMQPKAGTDVIDVSVSRSIGHWNGKRLVRSPGDPHTGIGIWAYVLLVFLVLAPAFYFWRSKKAGAH